MFVPSIINKNCLKVYEPHEKWVEQYRNKQIKCFSVANWNENIPKTLQELCVECIAANWIDYPILDEIILYQDRQLLLDILPETPPLQLSIPKIDDENYWKRCFTKRWPKKMPKIKESAQLNDQIIVRSSINATNEEYINSIFAKKHNQNDINTEHSSKGSKASSRRTSRKPSFKTCIIDKDYDGRTWKKHYCEMHVKEYLENLQPENYNPEKIKELCDLCGAYVEVLVIDEMLSSENSCNKIPLNSILTGLPNLTELSLRFKQTYVKGDFSWNIVNMSYQDISLFTKGLEKIRLKTLRVTNSDIDCYKAIAILKALTKHLDLELLDFSHCKIGDRGTMATARFIIENPVKKVFLANNRMSINSPKGINSLAYAMAQKACKVKVLDLRLNQFSDDAAANLLISSIAKYSDTMESLAISGCGLAEKCAIADALRINSPLECLDISNNALGEGIGTEILEALKFNTNLKKIDLRMCQLPSAVEVAVQTEVYKNRKGIMKPAAKCTANDNNNMQITWDDALIAEMDEVLLVTPENFQYI